MCFQDGAHPHGFSLEQLRAEEPDAKGTTPDQQEQPERPPFVSSPRGNGEQDLWAVENARERLEAVL